MATEKRLIDANELLDEMHRADERQKTDVWLTSDIEYLLAEQPTVDAKPVVHGRWVDRYGGKYANPLYECSECKKPAPTKCEYDVLGNLEWHYDLTPYCPNCGAKMDGDGNG